MVAPPMASQVVRSGFSAGERITVRQEPWQVVSTSSHTDCESLRLLGRGGPNRDRHRVVLYPFDRPRPQGRAGRFISVTARQWLDRLANLSHDSSEWQDLWAVPAAGIDIHPYQLAPALTVLEGRASRLLLADEVGLGKTIQAGIVICELQRRGWANRVLVLAPCALAPQWKTELEARFGVRACHLDACQIQQRRAALPPGVNPWSIDGISIVSLDLAKRLEVRRALEHVVWDVLIVDEAHCATPSSDRGLAVDVLASRSRYVLLLTATPHSGNSHAFHSLLRSGRRGRGGADPMIVFRRTRHDVGLPSRRLGRTLCVRLGDEERRMHRLLRRYTRSVMNSRERPRDAAATLAMIVLTKRALSSASSLHRSVVRRLDWLRGSPTEPAQLALWSDEGSDDDEPIQALHAPGSDDPARERDLLDELGAAASAASRHERKLHCLRRLLGRTDEPAIVFTEYRDTAVHVADALTSCTDVALLHGALPPADRIQAIRRFETGAARLLVATDVASEGLNLQARCRWVINFELPWNPVRLEQRVGRVDRLGQRRPVHALHLVARDTAEAFVLRRLADKIDRIRRAGGSIAHVLGRFDPHLIAEAAVRGSREPLRALGDDERARPDEGPAPRSEHASWPPTSTSPARARLEGARLSSVRARTPRRPTIDRGSIAVRTAAPTSLDGLGRPLVARLPHRCCPAGTVIVSLVTLLDATGDPVGQRPLALLLPSGSTAGAHASRSPNLGLLVDAAMPAILGRAQAVDGHSADLAREAHRAFLRRARTREASLLDAFTRCASARIQPGLFDRRVLQRASAERALLERLRQDCLDRLRRLDRADTGDLHIECTVALVGIVSRTADGVRSSDGGRGHPQ